MTKKILIVEDDPKNLKLIRDLLQASGYDTIEATDGKKGIKMAKTKKPDLILMDILMPEMDGYSALGAIKADETTKAIPVLMLTALAYELNRQLGDRLGAAGYITKPFDRKELLKTISQLLSAS